MSKMVGRVENTLNGKTWGVKRAQKSKQLC